MRAALMDTVALITGASSGIGAATALELSEHGAAVILLGRREERLEAVASQVHSAGGTAMVLPCDVTDHAQAAAEVDRAVDRFGRLDVVVNNAGVMYLGPADEAPLREWHEMIDVNVTALMNITHATLPHLCAAARGEPRRVADLVNISSVGGRRASAGTAVYNATKFAVSGFSEALRQELTKQHVRVSAVEPGMVVTEVLDRSRPGALEEVLERFGRSPGEVERLQASDVADTIAYLVTRPRHVAISEVLMRPTEQV